MGTVRYSPPWDIAYHDTTSPDGQVLAVEQACFEYWLRDLAAHGVTPEIAFKPDYNYQSRGRIMIPDLRTYEAAISAFTALYSNCPGTPSTCADGTARVRIIAPWGEPEFKGTSRAGTFHKLPQVFYLQSGRRFDAAHCPAHATDANCGPALAAQMWVTVQHRCPSCTIIAGDFGSNQGKDFAYLSVYRKYLRDLHGGHAVYRPDVWAIHPYTDVIGFERSIQQHRPLTPLHETLVGKFARQLRGYGYRSHTSIWLDEVSSFTVDFSGHRYSRAIQVQGAYDLLTYLPRAGGPSVPGEPVVTRIYYMRYAGRRTTRSSSATPANPSTGPSPTDGTKEGKEHARTTSSNHQPGPGGRRAQRRGGAGGRRTGPRGDGRTRGSHPGHGRGGQGQGMVGLRVHG